MVEIKLEGPGKNALGTDMMHSIYERLEAAAGQPVLLTGMGDAFSAGLNLKEVVSLDADGMVDFLRRLTVFFRSVYTYPGPTVAAINGHAIAGGCVLGLVCDHTVATTNPRTRIGLNEVNLGLRFPPILIRLLHQVLSPAHIREAVLGAGLHDPINALRLGLVDEISDDPLETARLRLAALARHPATAYAASKVDLHCGVMNDHPEDEAFFTEQVLPSWTSDALRNRINAVLGKK